MIAEKEIKQIETPYDRILKVNPSTDLSPLEKRRIKTLINKWTIVEGMKKQKYVIEIYILRPLFGIKFIFLD